MLAAFAFDGNILGISSEGGKELQVKSSNWPDCVGDCQHS